MRNLRTFLMTLALLGTGPAAAEAPVLLLAQRFTLAQSYTYMWTAAQPSLTEGTIVVVRVAAEDARVRQVGGPVLYVGAVPAERVNNGDLDGAVIVFVPGWVDLGATPIHWGPPTLPERVDEAAGEAALAGAQSAPATERAVQAATKPPVHLADGSALYRHLADLIEAYAPSEQERARGYRGVAQ